MRKKLKSNRFLFTVFIILLIFLTASVSAQATGDPMEGVVQSLSQQIDWFQGTTFVDVLIWIIIPALGMYAIFRFMYAKAFEFAEENFRTNAGIGGRGSGISDMADSSSRLLAIGTAVLGVVFWGGFLGYAMVVAGAFGVAWFAWANWAGFSGTTSPLPSGDGVMEDAQERAEEAGELIGGAEEEEQDAERRAEQGDTSTADQEAQDALQKLEQALENILRVEEEIDNVLGKDKSEIENVVEEAHREDARVGGNNLGPKKDFENRLEELEQAVGRIAMGASSGISATNIESDLNSNLGFEYNGFETRIEEITGDLNALAEAEVHSDAVLEDEMEELMDVFNDLKKTKQLLDGLESEVQEAMQADNFEEELARNLGDENLYERASVDENEVREIGEKLKELESFHQEIESEFERAEQLWEKQVGMEESELEELERVRENLLGTLAENTEQARNAVQASSIDTKGGAGGSGEDLFDVLYELENVIPEWEQKMEQIESRMQDDTGRFEGLRDRLGF